MKAFILSVVIIFFIGCGNDNKFMPNEYDKFIKYLNEYVVVNILKEKKFDYYEIQNGEIVATIINMDLINVVNYFSLDDPSYNNSIYEIDKNFHLQNNALDIDKTIDAMITYEYNSLTKVTQRTVYIKDFGLYELKKNICVINSDKDNCFTYIYIRY